VPWYPKRNRYFVPCDAAEEIEQGDIFWGVPTLIARHPDLSDYFPQPLTQVPPAETLAPPPLSRVKDGISVHADPVIILPHTCDFYGPEKGRRNRVRLVARIERLADAGIADHDRGLVRSGDGFNHTYFLPSWRDPTRDADDMMVNLRYMTSVDAAYLSRERRLARLSTTAIIALRRRIANFFTDYAPAPAELVLADTGGGLIRNDRNLVRLGLIPEPQPAPSDAPAHAQETPKRPGEVVDRDASGG
jgi:hypothetical protein